MNDLARAMSAVVYKVSDCHPAPPAAIASSFATSRGGNDAPPRPSSSLRSSLNSASSGASPRSWP